MTRQRELNKYECNQCGGDLEIDVEYHDGMIGGLALEELSVFCPECENAGMFQEVAVLKKGEVNRKLSTFGPGTVQQDIIEALDEICSDHDSIGTHELIEAINEATTYFISCALRTRFPEENNESK